MFPRSDMALMVYGSDGGGGPRGGGGVQASAMYLLTVAPGNNIFTLQYFSGGNPVDFINSSITVIPF